MEGSRPVLAEIQALLSTTAFGNARRTTNGVDYNRAMMLFAVLEKRCGLRISGCDAYLNVIGGLTLGDPAADLAAALATVSSYRDQPLGNQVAAVGEVGLTGDLRPVRNAERIVKEAARLGFTRIIMPRSNAERIKDKVGNCRIFGVRNISEAIRAFQKEDNG
jgi:DNA repair protein RadA/Sms